MSPEQAVFAIAGAACILGAVTAATHRAPRVAGAALLLTLISLAVLYAGLAAPVLAAVVLAASLIVTLPLIVHHTVAAAPYVSPSAGRAGVAAAVVIGVALLALLGLAIAQGEVPVNVSVRAASGYDLDALRELLGGRAAVATGAVSLVFAAAVIATRSARRGGTR